MLLLEAHFVILVVLFVAFRQNNMKFILVLTIICFSHALRHMRPLGVSMRSGRSALRVNLGSMPKNTDEVVVEIVTRGSLQSATPLNEKSEYMGIVAAYDGVYEEEKEDRMFQLVESPALKVISILLNPSTMVLVLYLTSVGWSKVLWLQKFFKIFGKGTLVKKPGEANEPDAEELPFQTFECEVCKMEMRPARGRAEAIFGRSRFRCSRCGSKASAYFDVDDLEDPRAVARLERIEKEKNEEWLDDGDEGEDDDDYDDDDEDEE
jgi:hypothetical protein